MATPAVRLPERRPPSPKFLSFMLAALIVFLTAFIVLLNLNIAG